MALHWMNDNTADRLVGALCNTLMHSLWQGILLAAIAGLVIICTRKASSALRYNLLIAALVVFAAGVSATFVWQYQKSGGMVVAQHINQPFGSDNTMVINSNPVTTIGPVAPVMQPMPAPHLSFTDRVSAFMNNHHNTIVLVWFLIICARSLQLGFGLYGTYRLRRVHVFAVKDYWSQRAVQLADALGIKQAVTLLESGLAKVPMVIGHLKPVVLVPIGLLTALSAEEVEAILIHELAHIKRRDYLVNMLQSLMEIVFFFNPAVLWVSKLIKTERENCCDDLALAQNNNKVNYIRALISCEEYQSSVPAYAMAFPGGKGTLLDRVKRMASNRNHSLNTFEKTVLAVCLVVLGLGVSAFTAREDIKKAVNKVVAAIQHKVKTKDKEKIAYRDTIKKNQAETNNELLNKLTQLHPDTLKLNNSPINLVNHNLDSLIKLHGSLSSLQQKPDSLVVKLLNRKGTDQQLLASLKPDTNVLMNVRSLNPNVKRAFDVMHDIGRELYREHLIIDTNHLSINMNGDKRLLVVNGKRMSDDVFQRIYTRYGKKGENGSYSSDYEDAKPGSSRAYANNNTVYPDDAGKQSGGTLNIQDGDEKTRNIIADMMKDDIITSTDDLSFKIGTTEFVVNYKQQSEAVYQKYKAKYVPGHKKGDWIWYYNFDTNKWDIISGRKSSGDFEGTATGVFQGKEDGNSGGNKTGYSGGYNNGDYYRGSQKQYWDGQQAKIIDQMQREGLIANRRDLSFTLTDKTFVINGLVQNGEIFQRYRQQYVPANAKDNWTWSYNGPGTGNPPDANDRSNWRGRDWDAYSKQMAADRQRIEAERDKKLVADLLQDGLITDPNNVTFTLSNKKLEINGKKQNADMYQKYKDKYIPNSNTGDWSWTYSHHDK